MKKCIACLIILFITLFCSVLQISNVSAEEEFIGQIHYRLWANTLKNYVNDKGRVDYEGLLKNREEFDQFITYIENVNIETMTPVEAKAFWINVYNALTVKVILDKYPVNSIRHINFGLVWEIGRKAAGSEYSLSYIEHKILRPLGDPRIHFAINCASIGCPVLLNTPFYPDQLDGQLEDAARKFINDPEKVRLDRDKRILYHSAIFSWFEEDFFVSAVDIEAYIKLYLNDSDKAFLNEHNVSVKRMRYDWGLNKQ